jgi:hypothetical protein
MREDGIDQFCAGNHVATTLFDLRGTDPRAVDHEVERRAKQTVRRITLYVKANPVRHVPPTGTNDLDALARYCSHDRVAEQSGRTDDQNPPHAVVILKRCPAV